MDFETELNDALIAIGELHLKMRDAKVQTEIYQKWYRTEQKKVLELDQKIKSAESKLKSYEECIETLEIEKEKLEKEIAKLKQK